MTQTKTQTRNYFTRFFNAFKSQPSFNIQISIFTASLLYLFYRGCSIYLVHYANIYKDFKIERMDYNHIYGDAFKVTAGLRNARSPLNVQYTMIKVSVYKENSINKNNKICSFFIEGGHFDKKETFYKTAVCHINEVYNSLLIKCLQDGSKLEIQVEGTVKPRFCCIRFSWDIKYEFVYVPEINTENTGKPILGLKIQNFEMDDHPNNELVAALTFDCTDFELPTFMNVKPLSLNLSLKNPPCRIEINEFELENGKVVDNKIAMKIIIINKKNAEIAQDFICLILRSLPIAFIFLKVENHLGDKNIVDLLFKDLIVNIPLGPSYNPTSPKPQVEIRICEFKGNKMEFELCLNIPTLKKLSTPNAIIKVKNLNFSVHFDKNKAGLAQTNVFYNNSSLYVAGKLLIENLDTLLDFFIHKKSTCFVRTIKNNSIMAHLLDFISLSADMQGNFELMPKTVNINEPKPIKEPKQESTRNIKFKHRFINLENTYEINTTSHITPLIIENPNNPQTYVTVILRFANFSIKSSRFNLSISAVNNKECKFMFIPGSINKILDSMGGTFDLITILTFDHKIPSEVKILNDVLNNHYINVLNDISAMLLDNGYITINEEFKYDLSSYFLQYQKNIFLAKQESAKYKLANKGMNSENKAPENTTPTKNDQGKKCKAPKLKRIHARLAYQGLSKNVAMMNIHINDGQLETDIISITHEIDNRIIFRYLLSDGNLGIISMAINTFTIVRHRKNPEAGFLFIGKFPLYFQLPVNISHKFNMAKFHGFIIAAMQEGLLIKTGCGGGLQKILMHSFASFFKNSASLESKIKQSRYDTKFDMKFLIMREDANRCGISMKFKNDPFYSMDCLSSFELYIPPTCIMIDGETILEIKKTTRIYFGNSYNTLLFKTLSLMFYFKSNIYEGDHILVGGEGSFVIYHDMLAYNDYNICTKNPPKEACKQQNTYGTLKLMKFVPIETVNGNLNINFECEIFKGVLMNYLGTIRNTLDVITCRKNTHFEISFQIKKGQFSLLEYKTAEITNMKINLLEMQQINILKFDEEIVNISISTTLQIRNYIKNPYYKRENIDKKPYRQHLGAELPSLNLFEWDDIGTRLLNIFTDQILSLVSKITNLFKNQKDYIIIYNSAVDSTFKVVNIKNEIFDRIVNETGQELLLAFQMSEELTFIIKPFSLFNSHEGYHTMLVKTIAGNQVNDPQYIRMKGIHEKSHLKSLNLCFIVDREVVANSMLYVYSKNIVFSTIVRLMKLTNNIMPVNYFKRSASIFLYFSKMMKLNGIYNLPIYNVTMRYETSELNNSYKGIFDDDFRKMKEYCLLIKNDLKYLKKSPSSGLDSSSNNKDGNVARVNPKTNDSSSGKYYDCTSSIEWFDCAEAAVNVDECLPSINEGKSNDPEKLLLQDLENQDSEYYDCISETNVVTPSLNTENKECLKSNKYIKPDGNIIKNDNSMQADKKFIDKTGKHGSGFNENNRIIQLGNGRPIRGFA